MCLASWITFRFVLLMGEDTLAWFTVSFLSLFQIPTLSVFLLSAPQPHIIRC